jgi:predicted CXXCH cytochrome family protein
VYPSGWSAAISATLGVVIAVGAWAAASSPPAQDHPTSLPATNFSAADGNLAALPRAAPGFARATVASNSQAPDARPVGEKTCIACHKLEADHFTHTLHSLGLHVANRSDPTIPVCETCHGPGSAHAANPQMKGLIIGYTKDSGTPIATQTKTCLACHAGGPRDHWPGSIHQRNDLSCSDCHNPMAKFSVEGLMARSSINETCAQCHRDIRLQFNRRSHMPLPEGQMSCDDCHNPHGSNQSTLLVAPIPFLCQQCHTNFLHPNDLQTPQSLGTGTHPDERIMGRGCLTCHANIHGSNAPSGARFHE